MKINSKIKVSFVLYALVPLTISLISLLILTNVQKKSLENYYKINISSVSELLNSTVLLDKICESAITDIRKVISSDSMILEDDGVLDVLNTMLNKKYSFLLTTKDGEVEYCRKEDVSHELISKLPTYDELKSDNLKNFYLREDSQYIIKSDKFIFSDKSKGVVYVISNTSAQLREVRILLVESVIIFFLVLLLSGVILTLWLHRSVMKPLQYLKKSTNRIANGNLNFKVYKLENDEFGDLCDSFEIMRNKLQESIEQKMQYDADSKELISNISHDLKTPITTIKGYVEGLIDGVADTPEKRDKYLRTIYNKSRDMDRLIGELTLYSQLDTNMITYNFVKLDINSFMKEVYQDVSIEFEQIHINVTYTNDVKPTTRVKADNQKLIRVINNILGNSAKYIDKIPGKVDIRLREEKDMVVISISDNGKGIEEKELSRIFERFYRTDASRNSKQGGSGIGLAIVKKIIEAHGGTIWAESVFGEGTTISFSLMKTN